VSSFRRPHTTAWRRALAGLAAPALLSVGCAWDGWAIFNKTPTPPAGSDSVVIRGDKLETDSAPASSPGLTTAHEKFQKGEYWNAAWAFHFIADDTKNPPAVAEEARFYEAESLRLLKLFPRAADTYVKMLNDFPSGSYREQASQRVFDIANYWLDDTRKEMEQSKEVRDGKRWFVTPAFVNFDLSKPILDEQGRAIEKLEQVRYSDMTGPLADKALFLMGSVKFYNEDYKEADHYFTQLVQMHPNSPFASQAIDLAIVAKTFCNGGSDYDGTKVAEARVFVHRALASYPELAQKKGEYLERQLVGITMRQAEQDYKKAEFYLRTGKPQSAYFIYEIVRRRYPGTPFAEMAETRMLALRSQNPKVDQPADEKTVKPVAPDAGEEKLGQPRSLPEGIR
jgi:outer membrane protein assembly factor BamD (BamD/ComL family)